MANNCPFFQTVLSGLKEYTVFFKKLWHTNILKALIILAPYLVHFLLPVKWATCYQFHLQSPTSSEKLLFFAVALLSAVILKYVDPVWSNYSPALKKRGLYWISPVLPSFCGSVILSDENILGILWAQLLLQFSMECFETLQMFSAWNEDVRVVLV